MSTPTQHNFVLGTPTKEFSLLTLRELLYSAKSANELVPAKEYLLSYFARGETGVYKWIPKQRIFKYFLRKDARDSFIQKDVVQLFNDKDERIGDFNIQDWFFRATPFFSLEVNPYQPKIYRDSEDNGFYINLFQGFLHLDPPPFHEFSQETHDRVKLVLNHMREVLCSSDEKQAYYMMNLIMRIATGQKMQKTMFLYSGPGTGKTMLTWFLRKMVLGPKITLKKANEGVITRQFNKELEGKCLLVLEEMSNSKSVGWITFANRLKDFIDSDTLWIEEKHKTGYEVANITNLILNSNNSKTIRLDRGDRRYFIPDISEQYVENGIGMDHYYAPLDKAIKNPKVGKAFYSYALEYVKLNPDFDERKIPMTKTKLMMINRNSNIVHEFVKQAYVCNSGDIDISSSQLYTNFKRWQSEQPISNNKKPSTVQEFTRTLKGLGLEAKQKRVGDRKAGKRLQWYSASYKDLYTTFSKRNMIDEAENLDEPEGYQHKKNGYIHPAENLPEEMPSSSSQPLKISAKREPDMEKPSASNIMDDITGQLFTAIEEFGVTKHSTSPEVPIRVGTEPEIAEPEINPASIPLPESECSEKAPSNYLDTLLAKPSNDPNTSPEPYGIPGPSKLPNTPKDAPMVDTEHSTSSEVPIRVDPKPKIEIYVDKWIKQLYKSVENLWEAYGNDPDDYDWITFTEEIKDLSNHKTYDYKNDPYHYRVRLALQMYRNLTDNKNAYHYYESTYKEIADKFCKYFMKEKGQVNSLEGCITVKIEKTSDTINFTEILKIVTTS